MSAAFALVIVPGVASGDVNPPVKGGLTWQCHAGWVRRFDLVWQGVTVRLGLQRRMKLAGLAA